MLKRFSTAAFVAVAGFAFFSGGYWFGQSAYAPVDLNGPAADTPAELRQEFAPFWEVWQLVQTNYFRQPLDDGELTKGAIDGLLNSLDDPNTRYLPPEDQDMARRMLAGEFEGIGAEVESVDGAVTIIAPYEGSPAANAGLKPGDILRQADGVELTGMDIARAAALVRGPAGTTVHLVIERDGQLYSVDVVRDVIKIPSVRGEMLDSGLAYVRLSRFGDQTAAELEQLLATLMAQNPRGLILDLRQNPGGNLTTAVDVGDQFLPEGILLIERFGNGREELFEVTDEGLADAIPLAVLIDEGSASASEVLAGAIQDQERGVLIGQTSFGKGTVQTWQELSNGGGVRITIARWLTPDGRWIHEQGLTPDYLVPVAEAAEGQPPADAQLQAAEDYLLGRPVNADNE
ncbi:MAG: S41 family peptidase [Chloroflexota bacterium]